MSDNPSPCNHSDRVVTLEVRVEQLQADLQEILSELRSVNSQLTKYKGFIGGIAFVVSCLPVLWTFTKGYFTAHWK